jgi:MoaA/NifB/PqqE/SkfB family radical SAM enzyme
MKKNECYEILLNYKCNLNCLFCSQGDYDRRKELTFTEIAREIYKAKKNGYLKLGLSGGEPTIREDIIDIVRFARKVGFKFIRIQTNGLKLADFEFAKKLKEAGLTFCKFSLTSTDSKVHEKLTNNSHTFQKVIKAINNMKKLKVRIGNNILITKYNYSKLDKIILKMLDMGVSNFVIIYPLYTGNMFKNYKKLGVPLYKCTPYFKKAFEIMEKNNLLNEILFLNVPPCFIDNRYHSNVIGFSEFNTTVTSPDLEHIDLDENANSNKIKGSVCKKCIYNKKCLGIDREYIKIYGWKGFNPVKMNKEKKKEKIYLSDDERCLLEILKEGKKMSVNEIIKKSKKMPLCRNCEDANNIINAATSLSLKKLIKIEFFKGKYYFSLKQN